MKPSKKLQEPHHPKFSCFLACFGGGQGQTSGKKLAFEHSKKNHHHHRWLLSPYWSKVRLKKSAPAGTKTVPFELFGVSPTPSVATKSLSGGGGGGGDPRKDANIIGLVEKVDQEVNLNPKEPLESSNHKHIPTSLEDKEQDLCQKTIKSDTKRSNKTQHSIITRHNKLSYMQEKPSNTASMRLSKLDPLVGLSIVLLTLLIMIIWGRICAILCTSAWFYFVPMFHWKEDERKSGNENLNLKFEKEGKSWRMKDYKKRVVLEGFLERGNCYRVLNEKQKMEMFHDCD